MRELQCSLASSLQHNVQLINNGKIQPPADLSIKQQAAVADLRDGDDLTLSNLEGPVPSMPAYTGSVDRSRIVHKADDPETTEQRRQHTGRLGDSSGRAHITTVNGANFRPMTRSVQEQVDNTRLPADDCVSLQQVMLSCYLML